MAHGQTRIPFCSQDDGRIDNGQHHHRRRPGHQPKPVFEACKIDFERYLGSCLRRSDRGLGLVPGKHADLIISDYKMPQMDGAELIRRIRDIPALNDLPIVIVTVYEDREFRLQALEAGATDFLQSPVDHHEFATRARNLLKMRHQQLLLASRADGLERDLEHSERSREQALRDSSERLAQVIDTVPAMISAADRDGKILFTNAYQTRLLGLDPARVIGQDATVLFGEEQGGRSKSLDRVVWDTGRPISAFEEEFADRSGEKRTVFDVEGSVADVRGCNHGGADNFGGHQRAQTGRGLPASHYAS